MKTKNILAFALAAIMSLSMSVTAFAETNKVTLTYSNEASYEISIPDAATINQSTGRGTIVVDIDDANLADGTAVSVTVTSDNYDDGWYLVNTNDEADRLAYTIGTTEGDSDIANGDEVLSSDSVASTTLYVAVSDTSKVGTFTDTITFTSEIKSTIISFTMSDDAKINTIVYQAEEGMTWAEWANSEYDTHGYSIGHSNKKSSWPNWVVEDDSDDGILFYVVFDNYPGGSAVLESDTIINGWVYYNHMYQYD